MNGFVMERMSDERSNTMDREQAKQEVRRLAGAWIVAELRGDTAFLEQTLADDFMAVGPLGFLLTKQEWIGRHASGNMTYNALTLDEVTVRLYDQVAVLIGRKVQDAAYRGNSVTAQLRTTVVLVRQGGNWRLVGVHMSPIGQPPGFARS
jgi:ketosteroid isomerase-like protein